MDSFPIGKPGPALQPEEAAFEPPRAASLERVHWVESDEVLAAGFAVAACFVHLLWNGRYGYFRDELYYAACGQHLAWGYVDQAPLIAVIARVSRILFGDSLRAIRFLPALSSGGKILLTAWIVREFGGRRYAQILAATAMLLCPIYLTMDNFMSMNAFEPLFWMACVAISLALSRTGDQKLWLWFGLIAGIGTLNKHSMLFFGSAFFLSLLVTHRRAWLRSGWMWLGALISFLLFLPNLIWEINHHWATIEILRNVDLAKNEHLSWLEFIGEQAFLVHPLGAPICVAGLWFFLFSKRGAGYRFLGWTYLFLVVEFIILRGRIYYLAPIYPMLFAAGSVAVETLIENSGRAWVKAAVLAPLVVGGLVAAPLALPILPVNAAAAYAKFWDVDHVRVEKSDSGKLPQMYADMIGWRHQATVVSTVFHSLSPQDQARVAILAKNYGQAGAVDYFGPALGLPHAISGHNNYYLWGPQQYTGELVIAVGMPLEELKPLFEDIQLAATIENEYSIPEENNLPVYICRKPKMTLQQAWPKLKFYG